MFFWIIATVLGQPGSRVPRSYAPVETVYPATFKPSYRNTEATHHYIEATHGPKMYSPVQQIRQELPTTATVAGELYATSVAPKPVEYTPSFEPEMLSAAPEKSYYTAAQTDYPHSEMPSAASMDYYTHSDMPSMEYYAHSDMPSTEYYHSDMPSTEYYHSDMPSTDQMDYTYHPSMDYHVDPMQMHHVPHSTYHPYVPPHSYAGPHYPTVNSGEPHHYNNYDAASYEPASYEPSTEYYNNYHHTGDYYGSEEPHYYNMDHSSYEPASYEPSGYYNNYHPTGNYYGSDEYTYMPEDSHYDHSYQPSYDYSHHDGYGHDVNDYHMPGDVYHYNSEQPSYDYSMNQHGDYTYMPAGNNYYEPSYDYSHMNHDGYKHDYNTYTPEEYHYPSEEPMYYDSMNNDGEYVDQGYDYPYYSQHEGSHDGSADGSHDGDYENYEQDDEHRSEDYNESEEHDDMPECLRDCEFLNIDSEDSRDMCEWWKVEGQQSNKESCLNDCSPGVTHYVNEKIGGMCADEPVEEVDPMACVMDCPIHEMDPHSAESFCPWFVQERKNSCFHDCTDVFLNMAQAHAEFTCNAWNQGENRFTNYINEPMADILEENTINHLPQCPAGYKNGDYCEVCPAGTYSFVASPFCTPCPDQLTSFPGSTSVEECFERKELLPVESYEDSSNYESEDHSMSADRQDSNSYEHYYSGESSQ